MASPVPRAEAGKLADAQDARRVLDGRGNSSSEGEGRCPAVEIQLQPCAVVCACPVVNEADVMPAVERDRPRGRPEVASYL